MAQVFTYPGSASANFRWLFQQLACHANDRNFVGEAFSEKNTVRSCVREIVQNTGDCARADVPAVLRLTWTSVPRSNLAAVHYDEIVERISGIEEGSRDFGRELKGQTVDVLLIEDNGTGMGGEWRRAPKANEKPGGLQAFGRGFGNSSKGRGSSGSKGLGRSAVVNASDARLLYCHTVREQDDKNFFFGMSLLDLHSYRGDDYKPDGYLYVYETDENGAPIAPPLSGDAAIACASALGISRTEKDYGSSICVPAVRDEFSPKEFAKHLVVDHFVQIANGTLTAVLKAPRFDLTLDASTIEEASADPELGGSPEHAALVRAAVRILACANSGGALDLGLLTDVSDLKDIPEDVLAKLREKYSEGTPACVRIELAARKVGERSERTGHLVLAALRADDLANGASILMRDGITKIDRLPKEKAVIMAIAADGRDNPVAEMLRDGEDPSHMRWAAATMKGKGWADKPAQIVRTAFCEGGRIILDTLASRDLEEDYDVYADLFGIDAPAEPEIADAEESPAKEEKESNNGDKAFVSVLGSEMIPPDKKSGKWGFKAFLSPIGLDLLDGGTRLTNVRIGTVYAFGEGSTDLSNHSIGDFDLRKFDVTVKGGKIKIIGVNDITVNDLSRDFEMRVVGPFSRHRGLHAVLISSDRESKKSSRGRKKKES